jgi:hypothetical protein
MTNKKEEILDLIKLHTIKVDDLKKFNIRKNDLPIISPIGEFRQSRRGSHFQYVAKCITTILLRSSMYMYETIAIIYSLDLLAITLERKTI